MRAEGGRQGKKGVSRTKEERAQGEKAGEQTRGDRGKVEHTHTEGEREVKGRKEDGAGGWRERTQESTRM